jgi:hypothetical protein
MNPVVTHFECGEPSGLSLTALNINEILARVLTNTAEFIKLFVIAFSENPTIPNDDRG